MLLVVVASAEMWGGVRWGDIAKQVSHQDLKGYSVCGCLCVGGIGVLKVFSLVVVFRIV